MHKDELFVKLYLGTEGNYPVKFMWIDMVYFILQSAKSTWFGKISNIYLNCIGTWYVTNSLSILTFKEKLLTGMHMLASEFLKQLKNLSQEDLLEIKGIGDVLAQNYLDFLSSPRYQKLIQDFRVLEQKNKGVEVTSRINLAVDVANLPLAKETICITGTFEIPRPEIKTRLEQLGAKVTDSVTGKTTILLAGEKAGSKLDKAKQLGLKIIENLKELIS